MSLVRNTFWNLSGYIIPSLIAIPALGYLARALGPERFGLFTLAVAIVGYASIFDAGLTRAVIREVSFYRDDEIEIKKIISNSTFILVVLGLIGGLSIFFGAPHLVDLLKVGSVYKSEVISSIELLGITIPLFLLNQVWLGTLEGFEQFKKLNLVKSFNSSFIAGFPAIFVLYKPDLIFAVLGLLLARVASLLITFYTCRSHVLSAGFRTDKVTTVRLLKYGGWITISNIVSPLMTYLDRFLISNITGAANVAFYTAPSEGVQRLTIIPGALSRAVFPKLSRFTDKDERQKQQFLAYFLMSIAIFPLCLLGVFFSEKILTLWMGNDYAGLSATILKILLVGFFFNCIAQIPFSSIQAAGHSRITALLHIIEVIPYLILLYTFIHLYGLIGAAFAWSIRTTVDCLVLILLNKKIQ
ncbi:TPA: flippase [Enterobacter hormaechei subsp. steigerwaltii]|uniref:flippase n=1 Tax=Enterobacter hormaechei TaxID=158836 RepID=UPI00092D69AA|nr:flippase [Enterobacter hormaechei]MDO0899674.1 flippase [Enterobacter hormaechei]UTI05547.1 flippase [Enterobacter hormaechei subsp. steigerwaltii]HCM9098759.1 flippase [Enterobacter hormaechei subsp. steigerwaltii]